MQRQQLDTEKGRRENEAGNPGQPACIEEGQVDGKKLTLPKRKIYSCWQHRQSSPVRVLQGFLRASLAAQGDLKQGRVTQPVNFQQL